MTVVGGGGDGAFGVEHARAAVVGIEPVHADFLRVLIPLDDSLRFP